MQDTKMQERKSNSSEDNPLRKELLWEFREEELLLKWAAEATTRSTSHDRSAVINKWMHQFWGFLNLFIAIVFTGLTRADTTSYVPTIGFVVTGSISAVCTFFKFAALSERHHSFSNKYSEYTKSIEAELCKHKADRIACDVFINRSEMQLNGLNRAAP